jgi:universal stress protein E
LESIRNVLVVVDPTREASAAVPKAAHLAAAAGARLTLYLCDHSPALAASRFYDSGSFAIAVEPVAARHTLHLDRLAAPLRAAGLDVRVEVEFYNPLHQGILRAIERLAPDLVVKDTHHHDLLQRTLYTNTDWHLIRGCRVPLLLAHEAPWHTPARLGAAVDPDHPGDPGANLDHLILHRTLQLAALLRARPVVVHVFSTLNLVAADPLPGAGPAALMAPAPQAVAALRALHRSQLESVARAHGIDADDTFLADGTVADALPEFVAARRLDLLVLGAVTRGALGQRFIGSTAERVLERLACDLLVVHPGRSDAG